MKTSKKSIMLGILMSGASICVIAQNQSKPSAAVVGIDSKGVIQDPESVSFMVRLELEKTNVYNMIDKYDVSDALKNNNINAKICFGKSCIVAAGKAMGADKMITGNIERFSEKIIISLKVIDVKTEAVEKQDATEYLNLQPELQKMIEISVKKLLGIAIDQNMVNLLINYDTPFENPITQIHLTGPRMGASIAFGSEAKILAAPESQGGYNMNPIMFQIGWQQEWQYLSAGNFQALVELIPVISGLQSSRFIPSVSVLNGFRMGKAGWEFAMGPTFGINKTVDGVMDSRGNSTISSSLIFGLGRTFKSGYLNIPVNVYVIPNKDGTLLGLSFGFNINKKPKIQ